MSDEIEVEDNWREVNPPDRFDTRTFHHKRAYTDLYVTRAHIAYYDDKHTVESQVDGEYEFFYNDTQAEAYAVIEDEMQRINGELDGKDDIEFLPRGGRDE